MNVLSILHLWLLKLKLVICYVDSEMGLQQKQWGSSPGENGKKKTRMKVKAIFKFKYKKCISHVK